ncbi:hypothetical protein [Pseudomonas sp. O230]|uniref:hypothetical protein n=1 Tax=Pseudomonas sp. O230 TaxID=3159450 RepID=UPI00387B14DA
MKFRKKPTVIDGIQWNGGNLFEVVEFMGGTPDIKGSVAADKWTEYSYSVQKNGLTVQTLEGPLIAPVGHWILKGDKGECWPVRPDYFSDNYEAIE